MIFEPGDAPIEDIESAGLPDRCSVRLKLFTLDNRLILRHAGRLSAGDRARVATNLAACLQSLPSATSKKKK